MEQKITLADLASGLSRRASVPSRYSEDFVRSFFNVIEEGLMHDNIVKVKGFGTFKLVGVDARESINVNTGERFEIAGHTKVSFIPDPALRDAVNKPFLEFETVVLNEGTDTALMESMDVESEMTEGQEMTDVPVAEPAETLETEVVEEQLIETPKETKNEVNETAVEETAEETVEEIVEDAYEEPAQEKEDVFEKNENVVAPAQEEVQTVSCTSCSSCHCWAHFFLFLLTAVVFTVLGYAIAEYWHPVTLPEFCQGGTAEETPVCQTAPVKSTNIVAPKPADSTAVVATATEEEQPAKQPSETLAYPQVEGGEYWIVGIEGTEIMKPGCTLLNFSLKYYKSKDFVDYICTMNDIKNPDIVPLNKELRIPKLKKK